MMNDPTMLSAYTRRTMAVGLDLELERIVTKRCCACGKTKTLDQYYVKKYKRPGRTSYYYSECKDCHKLRVKEYQETPEIKERRKWKRELRRDSPS